MCEITHRCLADGLYETFFHRLQLGQYLGAQCLDYKSQVVLAISNGDIPGFKQKKPGTEAGLRGGVCLKGE